jgi:hypothetical protein
MFTKLYLDTTSPGLTPKGILRDQRIYWSALFHTIMYLFLFEIMSVVFFGKLLPQSTAVKFLALVGGLQVLGYAARVEHVNRVYETYGDDKDAARAHIDKQYITWFFIG